MTSTMTQVRFPRSRKRRIRRKWEKDPRNYAARRAPRPLETSNEAGRDRAALDSIRAQRAQRTYNESFDDFDLFA